MSSFWAYYAVGKKATWDVCDKFLHNGHVPEATLQQMRQTGSKLSSSDLPPGCFYESRHRWYGKSTETPFDETLWSQIKGVLMNPYFAPLMADDLTQLPPAFVLTAQCDVLRDEGIMYAKKLGKAENDVTWRNSPSAGFHAFINPIFIKLEPDLKMCYDEVIDYIKATLIDVNLSQEN